MSTRQFVYSLLFKGDPAQAKAAAGEVKAAVAAVTAEAKAQTPAVERQTAATDKSAAANRRAAKEARDRAAAEKLAREEAERGARVKPPAAGAPSNPTAPKSKPAPEALTPAEKEAMKASYVPLFAAQRGYQVELTKIQRAEKLGAITKEESAAAQTRLSVSHERTVASIKRADTAITGNTGRIKLQSHEATNLAAQMNDVFQSLALGMSPSQVLLQQGPQITQLFGGIGNTLKFLKQSLTGMRVLMGGTAAAVVGGALAWDQYLRSTKAVEIAAAGRGQRIATTPGMLEEAARAGAGEAGLSVRSGRDLTAQLLSTGQIGAENIPGIVGISKDFGVNKGLEGEALWADLAKTFAEPAKAADELHRQWGFVNADASEQIQRLVAQNKLYEAQALLLEQLKDHFVDAGEASTWMGRIWSGAGRGISNIWDTAGETVAGMAGTNTVTLEDRIAQLKGPLGKAKQAGSAQPGATGFWADRQKAWIREQEAALAKLEAERDALLEKGQAGEISRRGVLSNDIASRSPANSSAIRQRAMADDLAALKAGRDAPDLSDQQRQEIDTAIEAQTQALDALINRKERQITLDRMDVQIATERNPMRRAELAGLKALVEASGQNLAVGERFDAMMRARRQVLNETLVATANQSAGMLEEAAAREKLNGLVAAGAVSSADANDWLERELTMRPLIAAAAQAEGEEKAQLLAEIDKLTKGYDELAAAKKREILDGQSRASADRLADIKRETEMVGKSAAERIRAQAQADAERSIRDMGLDPAGSDAAKKRADAAAEADARIEADRRRRAYDFDTSQTMDGFDAAARLARNPVQRADIEAQKEYVRVLRETHDAEQAAAAAAQVRARAMAELAGATQEMIRGQEDQLGRLGLEASLAGATDATRARVIAQYEAELYVRQQGIDAASAEARQIVDYAVQIADAQLKTERLADAWGKVRTAAEGAIDGPIDALLSGDFEEALSSLAKEVTGLFADIAIKNPLKNAILGTNYGTLQDVGGLGGIWAKLTGNGDAASITASSMGQQVGSMQVTAGTVMIGGAGIAGLMGGAANMSGAPTGGAMGGLNGSGDVQSQVWSFFAGKGLKPHQIAAIMGNVSGESSFNPLAQGDYQNGSPTSFGLFQHHAERGQGLLNAVGGQSGLGNVNAQLEYVWKELQTSENGALQKLLASQNVGDATSAWMKGFERPSEDAMAKSWPTRLGAAEAALAKFQNTTTTTAQGLGSLGTGFDVFGNALAQGLSGAANGGGSGGFLSTLIGGLAGALGIPGFVTGGNHRGGLRIVGENGPELEYTGPSTILPSTLTRSIMTSRAPVMAAANSPAPVIQLQPVLVNNTSRQMAMEVEETTDARGQKQQRFIMSDVVAEGIATPGGKGARTMKSTYGMKPVGRQRT